MVFEARAGPRRATSEEEDEEDDGKEVVAVVVEAQHKVPRSTRRRRRRRLRAGLGPSAGRFLLVMVVVVLLPPPPLLYLPRANSSRRMASWHRFPRTRRTRKRTRRTKKKTTTTTKGTHAAACIRRRAIFSLRCEACVSEASFVEHARRQPEVLERELDVLRARRRFLPLLLVLVLLVRPLPRRVAVGVVEGRLQAQRR